MASSPNTETATGVSRRFSLILRAVTMISSICSGGASAAASALAGAWAVAGRASAASSNAANAGCAKRLKWMAKGMGALLGGARELWHK